MAKLTTQSKFLLLSLAVIFIIVMQLRTYSYVTHEFAQKAATNQCEKQTSLLLSDELAAGELQFASLAAGKQATDSLGQRLTETSKFIPQMSGERARDMKTVLRNVDDLNQRIALYCNYSLQGMKTLEATKPGLEYSQINDVDSEVGKSQIWGPTYRQTKDAVRQSMVSLSVSVQQYKKIYNIDLMQYVARK